MPIISSIGRKALPVRILIWAIYVVLTLGGVTMVYPLLLMVSGSVKGGFDSPDLDVIPQFLTDETTFFQRYLESKYSANLGSLNDAWGTDHVDWKEIRRPDGVSSSQLDDFDQFRRSREISPRWRLLGHIATAALNQRVFKRELLEESNADLLRVGELLGITFRSWAEVRPKQQKIARMMESSDKLLERTERYKSSRPVEDMILIDAEGHWKTSTVFSRYERNLEKYRRQTGRSVRSWAEVHLKATPPDSSTTPAERADWEAYVRQKAPFAFLKIAPSAAESFHAFLRRAHGNDIKRLNKSYGSSYGAFDEIPFSASQAVAGAGFVDFNRFIREAAPLSALSLDGPNFRYHDFLRNRFHGDIAAARAAWRVSWKDFEEAAMPTAAMDWRDFQNQKSRLRWEFLIRNYSHVLDFLARHGRGIQNTLILCVLFLVTHLTINPLAAYALSRFGLPSTYKILLFCMATVAFPGEVMMIPSFLQLKEFNLLNTFWALVLPGLASGYSIFLLKGFFDSLPRELYESATIDGAGEWTVFWNITMALSKPILAVMALSSFTGAFGTFFYALIICPDEKMWTLMVWLYQLQMISGSQSINYAALCLSSIPTLLVFIFCQRIILRGIVVPSEK
ncbi:MAG: carbohydrate ABC transporter permease [Verrucomicrobia bacterium]|nr:carbohydrate ABC transporter permease [Verrucomicrobiota bacterium]